MFKGKPSKRACVELGQIQIWIDRGIFDDPLKSMGHTYVSLKDGGGRRPFCERSKVLS